MSSNNILDNAKVSPELKHFLTENRIDIERVIKENLVNVFDLPKRKELLTSINCELDFLIIYVLSQMLTFYMLMNYKKLTGVSAIQEELLKQIQTAILTTAQMESLERSTMQ